MSKFGVINKHSGYTRDGLRTAEKGGGGILGSILSVASIFVPALAPVAAAFNFVNAAATGNPLGMITSGFGFANSLGGFGGGDFGGGGGDWGGSDFGSGGGFGGDTGSWGGDFGSGGGGDWGGSDFGSGGGFGGDIGSTISPGTDFFVGEGNTISGDVSGLENSSFDQYGGLTGVEDTAGTFFENTNPMLDLPENFGGAVDTLTSANLGAGIPGIEGGMISPGSEMPSLENIYSGTDIPSSSSTTLDMGGSGEGTSLDTRGYAGDGDGMLSPAGDVPSGTPSEPSMWDNITNKVGKMNMKDWLKVGGGLYGMFNEQSQLKDLRKLADSSASMADPFASQRPQYQQYLSQSYSPTGLNDIFNREYMAGAGGQLMNQISARDAAQGRRSQYGARRAQLQSDFMNRYMPQYRQGLMQPSGANANPANAAQLYASASRPAIMNQGRGAAGLLGSLSDMFA